MTLKRIVWLSIVLLAFPVVAPASWAQEPAEPDDADAAAAPADTEEGKVRFWGDRFALYVEVGGGGASADDINSSISTRVTKASENILSLDDNTYGRVVVGWQLPVNRGHLLVAFDAYKEDSYEFRTSGTQAVAFDPNQGQFVNTFDVAQLPWWTTSIRDGRLLAERNIPQWVSLTDDANNNGRPDPDEVSYASSPSVSTSRAVPDDLFNRVQTVDLLYRRDFGGRRIEGRWSAGVRYFVYEGNIPAAAWLTEPDGGGGYTDGQAIPLLSFSQETTGIGPTGSLGVQFHFFRERLTLEAHARASFVVSSLETDSGPFFTLIESSGLFHYVDARLTDTADKSVWQLSAEFGGRLRLVEGLFLEVGFSRGSYQDAILLPNRIAIPATLGQAPLGSTGLYSTQDYVVDTYRAGLSFQF